MKKAKIKISENQQIARLIHKNKGTIQKIKINSQTFEIKKGEVKKIILSEEDEHLTEWQEMHRIEDAQNIIDKFFKVHKFDEFNCTFTNSFLGHDASQICGYEYTLFKYEAIEGEHAYLVQYDDNTYIIFYI